MDQWQQELTTAFEILLGRPLGTFSTSSRYVVYAWADEMSADAFDDLFHGDLDLATIADGELIDEPGEPHEAMLSWDRFAVDHGRSVWSIEDGVVDDLGVVAADLRAAGRRDDSTWTIAGADLARVLLAHRDTLDEAETDDAAGDVHWLQRVHTDGTLAGAMRAATWTLDGPSGLLPPADAVGVEPEWAEALTGVGDPRLRDHLRMLCLTAHSARSEGAYYLGRGYSFCFEVIAGRPGHEVVAGWEFGEGQGALAVFEVK
ncbi:hypothetical protein [Cryptosporangium japonicum]|uniref:Uncharacterized protein n=1 Tax=Cryptosporangium japonicum TaxID=80872 RepID=A0ABN0V0Y2_9ACTN